MKIQAKNIVLYLMIIFLLGVFSSCNSQDQKEYVWYVIQPELELGKTSDLEVHFDCKPDSIYTDFSDVEGFQFTESLDEIRVQSESSLEDDSGKTLMTSYQYTNSVTPSKLGRIDLPTISIVSQGQVYKSKPMYVYVVDSISIDTSDVRVQWSSNKKSYKTKDTIRLSLYQYSKFTGTMRTHTAAKNLSMTGEENEIKLSAEYSIDNLAGIEGFEDILDKNFQTVAMNFSISDDIQSMVNMDNELYIKTLILDLKLVPKSKGKYVIGPSDFDYRVYKSIDDFYSGFVPTEEGNYQVTTQGASLFNVKSNDLILRVR